MNSDSDSDSVFRADLCSTVLIHWVSSKPTPRFGKKPIPTVTAIFRAEHAFLCPEQPPIGKKLYLYEGNYTIAVATAIFTHLKMAATAEIVSS